MFDLARPNSPQMLGLCGWNGPLSTTSFRLVKYYYRWFQVDYRLFQVDYRWRHLDPVAQVLPSQLGKDVNTWTVAFKFLCRKGVLCAPGRYITRAQSIKRIGLHMKHGGFNQRPHLIHVLDGPQWLQKRLVGSRATQRTLKFALLSVPQA